MHVEPWWGPSRHDTSFRWGGITRSPCADKGERALLEHQGLGLVELIRQGRAQEAQAAVEAGARVEETNPGHFTPLLVASQRGMAGLVRALIARGADLDAQDLEIGRWPLLCAALGAHLECAVALMEAGARLDLMTQEGQTLLEAARRSAQIRQAGAAGGGGGAERAGAILVAVEAAIEGAVARGLGGVGVDVALRLAALGGRHGEVRALLAAGAGADVADHWGAGALTLAVLGGHAEVVGALLEAGADPHRASVRLVHFERVCLHDPIGWAVARDQGAALDAMAAGGVELDRPDLRGDSPLMLAARWGRSSAARALIDAGASRERQNRRLQRALDVAIEAGHEEIAALLRERPAR